MRLSLLKGARAASSWAAWQEIRVPGWAEFGYRPYGPGSGLRFIAGCHAASSALGNLDRTRMLIGGNQRPTRFPLRPSRFPTIIGLPAYQPRVTIWGDDWTDYPDFRNGSSAGRNPSSDGWRRSAAYSRGLRRHHYAYLCDRGHRIHRFGACSAANSGWASSAGADTIGRRRPSFASSRS